MIEGSDTCMESEEEIIGVAARIGYPVIVKAGAGGGGRGMRVARDDGELRRAFVMARAEAEAGFGDNRVYVERFISQGRHVEFQVLGDARGNLVHLFERECSLQRRHQKLIEAAPCPALTPKLREKMAAAARSAAGDMDYVSACAVELLLAGECGLSWS